MKFIPGTFVITSQEDKGKSFKIPGFHTPDGSVVTIGREDVNNERRYAHIRIADKFATVSRKQAEILFAFDKLYVKNLSATNYTVVDGYELKPNERREISAGSIIKMGELEFTYQN
jgi:pSer/pThr/pTyr-binding forkhead associated (FHA) protein